ncbi:AraC family transcriptional regulator [Flavobacterium sp. 90]|uniref:AraC family transcriptional regulator n=1 Tax=unclassified Flavobacterium TaxID=196869 RepID=UPI000EB4E4F8|nr:MULTISPECIES: AraC family transcriptional regulator [unclassified Flavobacterium]RKR04820.1 AraC family transcriptional regulator [Flavobacterium sp. 81]TCK56141.1 AraC family transcriptional regulator [Flavobacterium sp. 90]
MIKNNIYLPYEVIFSEITESLQTEVGNNFFELLYIVSGTGIQTINQNRLSYEPGHLFLITPQDFHSLEIKEKTTVFQLRFTDIYIKNGPFTSNNLYKLEYILHHAHHQPGCILKRITDKNLVHPVIEAIRHEYHNPTLYNTELIQLLINTLIVIIARNISEYLPENINKQSDGKTHSLLEYIQTHIYEPEKLSVTVMSEKFGISETYLGRYFKKQANETLQDYISKYRIKLVENRLLYSDLRVGEIANELGFNDESHLNKIFKKHRGTTPSAFRKKTLSA